MNPTSERHPAETVRGSDAALRLVAFPTVHGRFIFRFGLWIFSLGIVAFAWGLYNAWPPALFVTLSFLPVCVFFAVRVYRKEGLGLATTRHAGEWEMLVSSLLFAIGVASGTLLLMSVGWVSIGVACLRPDQRDLRWTEWLKVPFLFLIVLPVTIDLAGSRHDWIGRCVPETAGAAVSEFPTEEQFLHLIVAARLALLSLGFGLPGTRFWAGVPLVPALLWAAGRLADQSARSWNTSSAGTWTVYWLLVVTGTILVIGIGRSSVCRRLAGQRFWKHWHWDRRRSISPWLAALVIVLHQGSLAEEWQASAQPGFHFFGGLGFLAVLLAARLRRPLRESGGGAKRLVIASLFILLGAEWTDHHFLRHMALGLLLSGIASWRQTWPLWAAGLAVLVWLTLLTAPFEAFVRIGIPFNHALLVQRAAFSVGLIFLGWFAFSRWEDPASPPVPDLEWQPAKRFSFILLCLLTGFQTLSVLWPEEAGADRMEWLRPESSEPDWIQKNGRLGLDRLSVWRFGPDDRSFSLTIGKPASEPVRVVAPEWVLKSAGWRVTERRYVAHPRGQAAALRLIRDGSESVAVYWFDRQKETFADFQRARHILWSGWNLSHRHLRMMVLHSEKAGDSDTLISWAETEGVWQ